MSVWALLFLAAWPASWAAEPQAPSEDPFLEQYAATYRFSLGLPRDIRIPSSQDAVFFLRSGPRSFVNDLYELDPVSGRERVLLTAERVLRGTEERLSAEELARRERARSAARGIASFAVSEDGKRLLVPLSGGLFVVEREPLSMRELKGAAGYPIDARFSPDGDSVACVRDGDLYVTELASGRERRLTVRPSTSVTHGLAEFVAQEEMGRMEGYWWSPDSRRIAYQRSDVSGMELFHIADPMRPETPPPAWPYPRAGKRNAEASLGIVPASGGRTTWVSWDRERYPYLATVRWEEKAPLTILVQNRAQTEEALLKVDERTGATQVLLTESDPAWLNLDPALPRWLPDGSAFLWTTEREGAWRLELRSAQGALLRPLTPLGLGLDGLLGLDPAGGWAYVAGGPDPAETHLYRVPLAGGEPERLTQEPGVHGAVFPRIGSLHARVSHELSGRRHARVHRAAGVSLGELVSVAEQPPFQPELTLTHVGERKIRAALVRPRMFVKGRRYAVIVQVYGGPNHLSVSAARGRYLLAQWLADQGFIVAAFDGRGTPRRGKEWERAIKGDLIGPALADQAEALRELGRSRPEMDLSRVGIYGWSFGGYFSAMAVMRLPDTFHAGVAGAPVADWLDYDTHYTERYLGLPSADPEAYSRSSALSYASGLRRPLLLIHGTTDDNVYFLHSLKLSDALFRSGRHHEFVPMAGFTHMVADPLVTTRLYQRIADFFGRRLR